MKKNYTVNIGNIKMGGGNPIVIQSMTNTDTSDVDSTFAQVQELHGAGAQIIRMTVNDFAAAEAIPKIRAKLEAAGTCPPLVGDFHFNGNVLLEKYPEMALALDKYRINPGNAKNEEFIKIVQCAIKYNKPVRIGVNGGSLDQEILDKMMEENTAGKPADEIFVDAMVESALQSAKIAEKTGLAKDKIVISVKVSNVPQVVAAYKQLSKKCDYPLHLGLTEAGAGLPGTVSSSIALGILLNEKIGDTIRVSITPSPTVPRTREIEICQHILQSLGLKSFRPKVTSCPGCGRTTSTFFQSLAEKVNKKIDDNINIWIKKYPGVENLKIAVMGCVVNGPGESKHTDIAISLPGKMEDPFAPVYIDGKLRHNLTGDNIENQFFEILDEYIEEKFSK